jgi:hypothetical protein
LGRGGARGVSRSPVSTAFSTVRPAIDLAFQPGVSPRTSGTIRSNSVTPMRSALGARPVCDLKAAHALVHAAGLRWALSLRARRLPQWCFGPEGNFLSAMLGWPRGTANRVYRLKCLP